MHKRQARYVNVSIKMKFLPIRYSKLDREKMKNSTKTNQPGLKNIQFSNHILKYPFIIGLTTQI